VASESKLVLIGFPLAGLRVVPAPDFASRNLIQVKADHLRAEALQ
jgi:hypothetical protein